MNRREQGERYFIEGYNCAQAVVLAFKDLINDSEENLIKVSSSFGGGIGGLREMCGAVNGIAIVLGYLNGYQEKKNLTAKQAHYSLVKSSIEKFKKKNGSYLCRELIVNKDKYSCYSLVGDAVDILLEVLNLDK